MVNNLPNFDNLGGETWRVRRFADPQVKEWSCFNPSIGYQEAQGFVAMFRSSNYWYTDSGNRIELMTENTIKNRTYFSRLDKNLNIVDFIPITYHGFDYALVRGPEDPKIYWRNDRWEFTAVIKEDECPVPKMASFWLDGSDAYLIKIWDSPDPDKAEKNWMASPDENVNFNFVYGANKIYKNGDIKNFSTDARYKGLRGSSNLYKLKDGTYLSLMHKCYVDKVYAYNPHTFGTMKTSTRDYVHLFVRYDEFGKIIGMSHDFHFNGPGIEFGSGLVVADDMVYVSFGVKDLVSYFGKITLEKVMEITHDC
jgi:hypothetical protein